MPMRRRSVLAALAAAPLSAAARLPGNGGERHGNLKPETGTPVAVPSASVRNWCVPRPMFWSFDARDPVVEAAGLRLSFRVVTIGPVENVFSLPASAVRTRREGNRWTIEADALSWAGQQETAAGSFRATVAARGDEILVEAEAQAPEDVRAIAVSLHDLAPGALAQTGWGVEPNGSPVDETGVTFNYPVYRGGMPVWWYAPAGGRPMSIASDDTSPVPRRIAARQTDGRVRIDLFTEQDARRLGRSYRAPGWRITRGQSLAGAIAERCAVLERTVGLRPWDSRPDLPAWARDVSLVVTLHGMHWSGYIFNDYAAMGRAVRWITDRIPGRQLLFFLAGWEGRYYRTYGASEADARMGGAEGLTGLVKLIHERGAHAMAMYAGLVIDRRVQGFETFSAGATMDALPGSFDWSPMRGNQVDWAEQRADVTGFQVLNVGAPAWRDHLTEQMSGLSRRYGFDGSFLDVQPVLFNDRRHDALTGLKQMIATVRQERPDHLFAAETWIDLALPFIPLSQTPDGPLGWSDRYQRRFAHLSMGEPGRGSTGVHELGRVPYDSDDLARTYSLASLAVVEDTLARAPAAVERVLARAAERKRAS